MISENLLREQLKFVLTKTDLEFLGEKYEGKVRDCYTRGDTRYLITSDRISCFDVVVTSIPFKGQTLNQMAVHWFKLTQEIVKNHLVDAPDPNVMVARNCEMLPVEVIVRAYIAGSAWRDYEAGNPISGVRLPPGMKPSQKLPHKIVTPSTKAGKGAHDQPISEEQILSSRLVDAKLWTKVKETALALFALGEQRAKEQGLILVDTKYEFGLLAGELTLADEIHTMDSSRYWIAESYQERFDSGEAPEMLDKEPTRQWLLSKGYKGEGEIPNFSDSHRVSLGKHYINSFERITGSPFEGSVGPVAERVEKNLRAYSENVGHAASQ